MFKDPSSPGVGTRGEDAPWKDNHDTLRTWDNVLYPVARLNLEVEGVPVAVEAAGAKNLPTSVLLGTDVPELGRLLGLKPRSRWNKTPRALLAVTRAGARRQAKEEEE